MVNNIEFVLLYAMKQIKLNGRNHIRQVAKIVNLETANDLYERYTNIVNGCE